MPETYNTVTPIVLGKSIRRRRKKKQNDQSNNQQQATTNIMNTTSTLPVGAVSQNANLLNNNTLQDLQHATPLGITNIGSILDNSISSDSNNSNELEKKRRRAERFATSDTAPKKVKSFDPLDTYENFANLNAIGTKFHMYDKDKPVVGRCTKLEKSYLRLTSEPNPDLVRPLHILKKAFLILMKKHEKGEVNYLYLCDQFKALRQDLRVQMIDTTFTLKVYQTHARLALANGDIGEFNQCQSRISTLFQNPSIRESCHEEFTFYRVLYYILTEDDASLSSFRLRLLKEHRHTFTNKDVQLGFTLADARSTGNYHLFMTTSRKIVGLGSHIVELFLDKERLKTLMVISKSYNQASLSLLQEELAFEDQESLMKFFKNKGLSNFIVIKNENQDNEFRFLDTRKSRAIIAQKFQQNRKIDIKGQQ